MPVLRACFDRNATISVFEEAQHELSAWGLRQLDCEFLVAGRQGSPVRSGVLAALWAVSTRRLPPHRPVRALLTLAGDEISELRKAVATRPAKIFVLTPPEQCIPRREAQRASTGGLDSAEAPV